MNAMRWLESRICHGKVIIHPAEPGVLCLIRQVEMISSRSALSDLGLIADLFEKMLLNWYSFCLKSPPYGPKCPKNMIFNVLAFHKSQKKYLEISLNVEYFQIKVDLPHVGIRFWEQD